MRDTRATCPSPSVYAARLRASLAVLCTLVAACGGGGEGDDGSKESIAPVESSTSLPSPSTSTPSVPSTPSATPSTDDHEYLPVSITNLTSPINFLQVIGPTTEAEQQNLVGRVGALWSSGLSAQSGVYSMSYAPAYRLYFMPHGWEGAKGYSATLLDWLYYHHPDWIQYGSDGNVMFQFSNTTYPVVDVANPEVQRHMFQSMAATAVGFQALALDNVSTRNVSRGSVYQVGHYNGTTAPCPVEARPACGGTFVTQYQSANDPTWTSANLQYIKFISSRAKAAGLATVANLSYQGGAAWIDLANAVSGIVVENVPQHQGTTKIDNWYDGFMVDDLFASNLFNAANATKKFYAAISYLDGHDTSAITPAEIAYSTAWTLLTKQSPQSFLSAGQISSRAIKQYPSVMGGHVNISASGTLSAASATITEIPSTRGYVPGQTVSAPGLPIGTQITSVLSPNSIAISNIPTTAGTNVPLNVSGFAQLPIGEPLTPPPLVNPYASPPTGVCGWVNGANAGVCSREYSNGWVYMNPVCQYNGTGCSVTSNSLTIPAPASGSHWYDQFCNIVPTGAYALAPATAMVIAQGLDGQCPWPQS